MTPLLLLATGLAYALGVGRLAGRGDRWPVHRTLATAAGVAVLAVGLLAPPGDGFRGHAVQHVLLSALAPLLLVRGAPVLLALRALPLGPRAALLRVVHSRPVRLVTAWPVVLVVPVGSAYLLYLTPLFALTERSPLAHALVHLHMLLAGLLAATVLAGVDPLPHRPRVRTRLVVLALSAGAHDVLATLLYAKGLPAGEPRSELHDGARLLYYGVGLVELATAAALLSDWYARTGRALRRDRLRARARTAEVPRAAGSGRLPA